MATRLASPALRVCGLCVAAVFAVASSGYVEAAPLKIMPLGDSITEGVPVSGGYREPLYNLLKNAGYSTQFVGSLNDYPGTLPANQTAHEGRSGYVISAGAGRPGLADPGNIDQWLGPAGADPDIILLMIGTNDINLNYQITTAPDRLSGLISKIANKTTGLKPNAKLIVAKITPAAETVTPDTWTRAYNSGVADVVAAHRAMGENVSLVDMYSTLNRTSDLSDGLHPSPDGYAKMADVWFHGIQVVVPEPGSVPLMISGVFGVIVFVCWRWRS